MNLTEKFFNFAFLFLFFDFFFRFYYDVIGNKEIVYGWNGIVCVKRMTRGACSSCSLSVVWYIEVWSIQNVQNRDVEMGGSSTIYSYWYSKKICLQRKLIWRTDWNETKPTTQATSRLISSMQIVICIDCRM